MLTLKCTKKVQTYLNLKPIDLAEPVQSEEGFGAWYANLFYVDRRQCIVFMNEKTLLSFLLFGFERAISPKEELPEQCSNGISIILAQGGLQHCDLTGIIREINPTPQGNIDWEFP